MNASEIRFEWDEAKNRSNRRKHGVSFEPASHVFFDPLHVVVDDRAVDGEQRWQALGVVSRNSRDLVLLLVAHTIRDEFRTDGYFETIRIISARKATPEERRVYEDENGSLHT
jgi:uncharacterized DUF497 family protein